MCAICTPAAVLVTRRQSAYGSLRRQSKCNLGCIGRTASAPAAFESGTHRSLQIQSGPANRRPDIHVANWNVAAPNNNPFEYWATHEDEAYNDLMSSVQECIDNPAKIEVEIGEIFTNEMFNELNTHLAQEGVAKVDLDRVEAIWNNDLKTRKSISDFLKDTSFGEKRLISMPDRITGWIKTDDGRNLFRPSPITAFEEEMTDISMWWNHWKQYIFQTPILLGRTGERSVFSLLETIPRTKYPALSESEEMLSIPLQTLCLALFDAVYTHLLCTIAPKTWQPLKQSLRTALYDNKICSCISILERNYIDSHIIFIQEASDAFASRAEKRLDHIVLRPRRADAARRPQTSFILAKRSFFIERTAQEVTDQVTAHLKTRCVEPGDLCVYTIDSRNDGPFLLASFHGDSNGKSTLPVLLALQTIARDRFPTHSLIFGLDANTVSGPPSAPTPSAAATATATAARRGSSPRSTLPPPPPTPPQLAASSASALTAARFAAAAGDLGLGSCWDGADLDSTWTTYNARTYLQPQLQKAVGISALGESRHMQLKDWILFSAGGAGAAAGGGGGGGFEMAAAAAERDNTGCRKFCRGVMPSGRFPSDHAIVSLYLRRR